MKMISLFAGPGGMCMGAKSLGIESVGIEWDANACKTRRAAGLPTVEGDVRAYGPGDFPDADTLAGGPPCQTFTVAGNGSGRKALDEVLTLARWMAAGDDVSDALAELSDERTGLVLEPLRWALEAHRAGRAYRNIVLEQVPPVLPVWKEFARILSGLDYSVSTGLLNAEEYGVPQTRKRAFLVASLDGPAALPAPTHRKYAKGVQRSEGDTALAPWVAMDSVISRQAPFEMWSNCNDGSTKMRGRRAQGDPSFTITGRFPTTRDPEGSTDSRKRLTYGEAGALQSFPIDYPWSGVGIRQQIGNAAPPVLVTAVLSALTGATAPKELTLF